MREFSKNGFVEIPTPRRQNKYVTLKKCYYVNRCVLHNKKYLVIKEDIKFYWLTDEFNITNRYLKHIFNLVYTQEDKINILKSTDY